MEISPPALLQNDSDPYDGPRYDIWKHGVSDRAMWIEKVPKDAACPTVGTQPEKNPTGSKWSNSILCLTLHVLETSNKEGATAITLFEPSRFFSDIQHVNRGNSIDPRTSQNHPNVLKSTNPRPRLKDGGILSSLTKLNKFDQSLTRAMAELHQELKWVRRSSDR